MWLLSEGGYYTREAIKPLWYWATVSIQYLCFRCNRQPTSNSYNLLTNTDGFMHPYFHNHCKNEIKCVRDWFIGVTCSISTVVNITHSWYRPMQYISVKGDVIKVNPYTIQLFHRVKCIWFKGQIQAMAFIQGWHLWLYLHSNLQLLSKGCYCKDRSY